MWMLGTGKWLEVVEQLFVDDLVQILLFFSVMW